jgi:hypothetical protein
MGEVNLDFSGLANLATRPRFAVGSSRALGNSSRRRTLIHVRDQTGGDADDAGDAGVRGPRSDSGCQPNSDSDIILSDEKRDANELVRPNINAVEWRRPRVVRSWSREARCSFK